MYLSEYSGRIFPTNDFKTNDFLITLKEAFKSHWRNGHHPSLGKDTLFDRPDEALGYHLRKVHVNLGQYASYSYSCTEECWDEWLYGPIDERGNFRPKPTSNAYLIYAVNEHRDAAILAYWDPPAHKKAEFESSVQFVAELADKFYEKIFSKPMVRDKNPWHQDFLIEKPA